MWTSPSSLPLFLCFLQALQRPVVVDNVFLCMCVCPRNFNSRNAKIRKLGFWSLRSSIMCTVQNLGSSPTSVPIHSFNFSPVLLLRNETSYVIFGDLIHWAETKNLKLVYQLLYDLSCDLKSKIGSYFCTFSEQDKMHCCSSRIHSTQREGRRKGEVYARNLLSTFSASEL